MSMFHGSTQDHTDPLADSQHLNVQLGLGMGTWSSGSLPASSSSAKDSLAAWLARAFFLRCSSLACRAPSGFRYELAEAVSSAHVPI